MKRNKMENIWKIIKHPLINDNLAKLRDKKNPQEVFAKAMTTISKLMVFEVYKEIKTTTKIVTTPFDKVKCQILNQEIILIPILRAGLGMLQSFSEIIPHAKIGHVGLKRNQQDFNTPFKYYNNIPKINDNDLVIILDPMVATGNSAITTIEIVQKINKKCEIIFVSIISSVAAKKHIDQKLNNIKFFTLQIDPTLNIKKYIVPGFGDAGDRFFGS